MNINEVKANLTYSHQSRMLSSEGTRKVQSKGYHWSFVKMFSDFFKKIGAFFKNVFTKSSQKSQTTAKQSIKDTHKVTKIENAATPTVEVAKSDISPKKIDHAFSQEEDISKEKTTDQPSLSIENEAEKPELALPQPQSDLDTHLDAKPASPLNNEATEKTQENDDAKPEEPKPHPEPDPDPIKPEPVLPKPQEPPSLLLVPPPANPQSKPQSELVLEQPKENLLSSEIIEEEQGTVVEIKQESVDQKPDLSHSEVNSSVESKLEAEIFTTEDSKKKTKKSRLEKEESSLTVAGNEGKKEKKSKRRKKREGDAARIETSSSNQVQTNEIKIETVDVDLIELKKKAQAVIDELISTEVKFVEKLEAMKKFYNQLPTYPKAIDINKSRNESVARFTNCHKQANSFYQKLKAFESVDKDPELKKIMEVYCLVDELQPSVQLKPPSVEFKEYITMLNEFSKLVAVETTKLYDFYLEIFVGNEFKMKCQKNGFSNEMMKKFELEVEDYPIQIPQRIARHPLLLEQLKKTLVPDSVAYKNISSALDTVRNAIASWDSRNDNKSE